MIPVEYILRHGALEVSKYFEQIITGQRAKGKVAVLVDDYTYSLFFQPCNLYGYPKVGQIKTLEINTSLLSVNSISQLDTSSLATSMISEVTIFIERPLVVMRLDEDLETGQWSPEGKTYISLWSGRKVDTKKVPVEQLNVKELMILAQKAIENREGLVIDEAIRNKIYK